MKNKLIALLTALITCCALPGESLRNEDIMKMVAAGLSPDVIVMTIDAAGETDFDLSVDSLIELKANQVNEDVIRKMLETKEKESAAPAPAPATAPFPFPPAPAPTATETPAADEFFPDISVLPEEVPVEEGGIYYTRCNFYHEKGRHLTTNYSRGAMVPINTEVKVLSKGGKNLLLETGGQVVKIENVEDFSHRSIDQIASRMLSPTPIPLDRLGQTTAGFITSGQLRLGMTKEQVLMTRGYPPGHETHDVTSDRWIYWTSRFVKQTLLFQNGRLIRGRGLY